MNFLSQNTAYANTAIPTAVAPNSAIYAFWDDLVVDGSSNVRTKTVGTAPNRWYVIEWNDALIRGTTRRLSVEIILSENKNTKLQMQHKGIAAATEETGTSATVGIENSNGSKATQLQFNQGLLYDGLTVEPTSPK